MRSEHQRGNQIHHALYPTGTARRLREDVYKRQIVARSSFDYVEFPWYAVLAGISQAEDSEKGYGQGAQGYGKRYGAAFADGTIENFMTSAIFPSILHQDPRFFQSGKGGFWRRTEYAVSRIFITRTDSGLSLIHI